MRFPLAIGVLLSHAYVGLLEKNNVSDTSMSILDKISKIILDICTIPLPCLVVPGFFLISGYLFFLKWANDGNEKIWNWNVYKEKIHSRIYSLFIPYIIWNLIPLFIGFFIAIIPSLGDFDSLLHEGRMYFQGKGLRIFWNINQWGSDGTNILGLPTFKSTAPINLPLYYLRDLMGICLFSPLVFWWVKKMKVYGLCLLLLSSFLGIIPNIPGLRSSAIVYFTFGAYFSINNIDIIENLKKYKLVTALLSVALLLFIVGFQHFWITQYLNNIFVFVGLLALITTIEYFTARGLSISPVITGSIFFFYAAHEGLYLLNVTQNIITNILFTTHYSVIMIQYFVIIAITMTICILLREILKTKTPNFAKLLGA